LYDSRPAIEQNVDLVVWPESSTSTYILQGNDFYLKWIQGELQNSKLISGIPYYSGKNKERKYYNSAVLIQADSVKDIYHKLQLVPMAEYIPLSDYFTSLKKLNLGQSNFTHGTNYTIMDVNKIKCAVMICFESIFPSLSRQFVQKGAEVLLFLVNDGWYENPPQPQQHAKQAVYRAIENRRPVIRCTNTGISMVIDAGGNISHALPLNEKGMIQTTIKPQNISTFYTRHGDIFAKLNVISSLLIIVGGMIRKK
jgi:apolipoprotein N-acyltransferase